MYSFIVSLCCLLSTSAFAQLPTHTLHEQQMNKIFHEEVIPYLKTCDSTPDWNTFGKRLISLYGDTGEEVLLLSQTIYSMQQDDWANFSTAIIPYAKKYGLSIPAKQRYAFSDYMSRNARLLYQSGHKEEGIRWQILALPLAREADHKEMLDTIERMKKGD
ncbi:hypothetical protein [Chitinophaga pinensis]|uniref:Uncharacterized protein n=1 Tax=Chitinophaga pinensis (strain ATCC 43595 / DSM 2588 / LMG 13176 / NBRC 15968 / NCIMB 11800 / UQM 2034) TaxID=485918 RepID=A0A979GVX9_CHIPD|nr:hypothetical protein [Chitinophaga pinensis]ACU63723.1 hypothetical protein Cpin_6318 [Chitinophaga pinensis DSM 2588]